MHACVASVAISTTADMKIIVNKLLLVRGIESNFEAWVDVIMELTVMA